MCTLIFHVEEYPMKTLITVIFFLFLLTGSSLFASNNPVINVVPADVTVIEGESGTVTVALTITADVCPDKKDLFIAWSTSDGSAAAGSDYQSASGTITFAKGTCSKSQTISIIVNGDTVIPEADEIFYVNLTNGGTSPAQDFTINDWKSTITILPAQAELSIKKSAPPSALIDSAMSYTLTVQTAGGFGLSNAANVVLTDTLPGGMTYNGITAPGGWSCNYATGTLTCSAATLAPGYTGAFIIDVHAPATSGMITNTANISSTTQDPDTSNNSDFYDTDIVSSSADLSITKVGTPKPVSTASILTYTIDVHNSGTHDAENVQVVDQLPGNVQFVSIDGGSDWSCSQGQPIQCDYIANSGLLATNSDAGTITLKVTTPAGNDTIINTATVISTTDDPDISNNQSTDSTVVQFQTNLGGERNFEKYLQYNVFGDMKLIGNANLLKRAGDADQNYNDLVYMSYVDDDSDGSTFNSSSSLLDLGDPSHEILWAGLYWEGHLCDSTDAGKCVWSNSSYADFNAAKSHLGEIKLKTPKQSGYINITANNLDIVKRTNENWIYSAFADITPYLDADETGTYTLANLVINEGKVGGGGNYGGWSMLVIYKDPSNTMHYKNISVFNGFKYVNADNFSFPIDGFVTPLSGPVNASIALFAGDGDPSEGGVARMRIGTSATYDYVGGDAANPLDNLLNGSMADLGTDLHPVTPQTYGVDIDRVDVSSFMTNNQNETEFIFDVATPAGGVDYYTLSLFAFATDMTSPAIDGFKKEVQIKDPAGNLQPSGPSAIIYPGSEMIYTLTFKNSGDEKAKDVEIFDDFDFDGLTPVLNLTNFDASQIKLSNPNSTTWQSNPNCGYTASDNRVWCRLNEVDVGETYLMQFSVMLSDTKPSNDVNLTNTAYSIYKNATTDDYVTLVSDANGDYGGKPPHDHHPKEG